MLDDTQAMSRTPITRPPRSGRTEPLGRYDRTVDGLARQGALWLNGLLLRFAFASVLLLYYFNSSWGSLEGSLLNLFSPNDGAFAAMLPSVMEEAGYDIEAVAWPWRVFLTAGVMGELVLPVLVVVGLFGRIAAAGMIVVVCVQSYVDIVFHGLEEKSIGAMFDRFPDAVIWDQRLLWITILILIFINGPGVLSLDRLLRR